MPLLFSESIRPTLICSSNSNPHARSPHEHVEAYSLPVCVALLVAIVPFSAFAQSSNGSISGIVTDASGAVAAGRHRHCHRTTTTGLTRVDRVSNATGHYEIPLLPPGNLLGERSALGFQPLKYGKIVVNVGTDVDAEHQAEGRRSETVTVTAAAPLVETTRSRGQLGREEKAIENLPTNGRNFIDFVLDHARRRAATTRLGDISFAGQRGTLNSLVVDGANNDNTFFGQALGRTGSGRAPYQFSQDAVKEFQVNSNAYSAEYGRAGGAVINVVTKSGTNDVPRHGVRLLPRQAAQRERLHQRDQQPRRRARITSTSTAPASAARSCSDKHFFFANYDAQRNSIDNPVVLGVPAGTIPTDAAIAGRSGARCRRSARTYTRGPEPGRLPAQDRSRASARTITFRCRYNRQKFTGRQLRERRHHERARSTPATRS